MRGVSFGCLTAVIVSGGALADPVVGTWRTEPDRKGFTSHISVGRCGAAVCGTVLKAYDQSGREVVTANVGKRLFWDMRPQGGGRYDGGTVHVPSLNLKARATMELKGDRLRVNGCKGPACYGQTWTRLK